MDNKFSEWKSTRFKNEFTILNIFSTELSRTVNEETPIYQRRGGTTKVHTSRQD